MVSLEDLLPTPVSSATPEQIQAMREYGRALAGQKRAPGPYGWTNALDTIVGDLTGAWLMRRAGELQKGGLEEGAKALPTFDTSSDGEGGDAAPSTPTPSRTQTPDQTAATPEGGEGASKGATSSPASSPDADVLDFVKEQEGFAPKAKWDFKQWSGGYGTRAVPGQTFTKESAHNALVESVKPVNEFINKNVKVPLSNDQRKAFISFGHNLGTGEGGLSDLLPDINKGDWPTVSKKMQEYVHAGEDKKVLSNLVQRRFFEGQLALNGLSNEERGLSLGRAPISAPKSDVFSSPSDQPENIAPGASVSQSPNIPENLPPEGMTPTVHDTLKAIGVPGRDMSSTGALFPSQSFVDAIRKRNPTPSGPEPSEISRAIAGPAAAPAAGGGAPAAAPVPGGRMVIPPVPGLPPLPTTAQIQRLWKTGIKENMDKASQAIEIRQKALTPQQYVDPTTGSVLFGSPYLGYTSSGLPGVPQVHTAPIKAGGVEMQEQFILRPGPNGSMVKVPIQSAPAAGGGASAPGAGAAAGGPGEFPTGGSMGDIAAWAARAKANEAEQEGYAKKIGETYATKQGIIEKRAADAQDEIPQLQTLKKVIDDPSFYSGIRAGNVEAVSSALRAVGFSGDTATLMEYAKKLGSAASLENIREMGESGAVRVPEMHMIEKSNFDINNTPAANAAIVDIRLRLAQRQMETADLANAYANAHGGRIDRGFDQALRDHFRDKPLFSKGEVDRYDHILSSRKEVTGTAAQAAEARIDMVPPAALAQLASNPTPERRTAFEKHFGLIPGASDAMLKNLGKAPAAAMPAPPQVAPPQPQNAPPPPSGADQNGLEQYMNMP